MFVTAELQMIQYASGLRSLDILHRVEPLQALADEGIRTLQLDVTSQENIQKAVQFIIAEDKHIDAVVCNAGPPLCHPLGIVMSIQSPTRLKCSIYPTSI